MKCTELLENISKWQLDDRVKNLLHGTGFEYLNKISACRHDYHMLEVLISKFDIEDCVFKFDDFELFFGLRDILYITGLHITGKPVTGVDANDFVTLSEQYFGENLCMVEKSGSRGSIKLARLKYKFMVVPENATDEILQRHARAYVLYMLGSSIFSTSSGDEVSTMYLPLLDKVSEIKDYAWGAAALAHLFCSLRKYKEGKSKSLDGIAISLQIFFMLSLQMTKDIFLDVEIGSQDPQFPLIVFWSQKLEYSSRNTRKSVDIMDKINNVTSAQVTYNPYGFSNKFLPDCFKVQEDVCNLTSFLIHFHELAFHKPYKCEKQYPNARCNKKVNISWKLYSRGGTKGKDWRSAKSQHSKAFKFWNDSSLSKRPPIAIENPEKENATGISSDNAAAEHTDLDLEAALVASGPSILDFSLSPPSPSSPPQSATGENPEEENATGNSSDNAAVERANLDLGAALVASGPSIQDFSLLPPPPSSPPQSATGAPKMASNQVQEKGNSSSGKRPKAEWNEKNNEIFLKVCVEQVRAGNRPHTHFNKVGWANVIKNFSEQTGLSYEYKQMKNKWDLLKKEWQLWEKIKGKETEVGWDYASQTITASEEWWQAKIKEYPEAATFKDRGIRNLPEMEILFKDTVASGHSKFAPSGDPEQGTEANDGIDTRMTEERYVELIVHGEEIPSSSIQRQKRKRGGKDNKRGVGSRMCDQFDRITESLNSENTVTSDAIANVPTIADCLEMLKQLTGMEYGSETHILGIRLMKSKSNRETFVLLDDPILQLNWIKSHTLADLSRR